MSALTKEQIEECAAEIANERIAYSDEEWRIRQECAEKVRELAALCLPSAIGDTGQLVKRLEALRDCLLKAVYPEHHAALTEAIAVLAAPAAQSEAREPVGEVIGWDGWKRGSVLRFYKGGDLPIGTKLYTAPQTPPMEEKDTERYEDALQKIASWADAYPLEVFPEPDMVKARAALAEGGITLDAVSASCMRHVIEGVGKIAKTALGSIDMNRETP